MNNNDFPISDEQLDALIQRYFDAATSFEEEEMLRRAVAHRTEPRFNEIRAVLGFFVAKRRLRHSNRMAVWKRAAAVAAAVALIATAGFNLMQGNAESGTCYAMVGGTRIDDESQVLSLMQSGLGDIGDAAMEADISVQSQMADIASFINDDD